MKLAQYSHQCGPRKVCTWSKKRHGYTHTHTHPNQNLDNSPSDALDRDYFVIPSYSGRDPTPNESICIYKAD